MPKNIPELHRDERRAAHLEGDGEVVLEGIRLHRGAKERGGADNCVIVHTAELWATKDAQAVLRRDAIRIAEFVPIPELGVLVLDRS